MNENIKIPQPRSAVRAEWELYPDFTSELEELRANGISKSLLYDIIQKHIDNATYNRQLYKRYMAIANDVPIFGRQPYYEEEEKPINNRVNNDFFGEIVDFKVGYFSGEPISYSYSTTEESEEVTGGEKAVDTANKALTDFTTRNNMFGVDMETTKYASIYGYAGRLFYIDKEGMERVMPVHGYETIILSDTDISEPEYAIRYYVRRDVHGIEHYTVEFYDSKNITVFKGGSLLDLEEVETRPHLFDYCPLQGIANNKECIGDAEKVLALIDDYDKVVSDNSNEIESFVNALLLVNLNTDDKVVRQAQRSGALIVPPVGSNQPTDPVKWITKDINDAFNQHHLERLESNIYRFSKTPRLDDEHFGEASGISLRFKLHGLDAKCSVFEASMMNSAQHMWRVLCSAWAKKGIHAEPLQFCMSFKRNFPQNEKEIAEMAQILRGIGMSKRYIYGKFPDIDDVDYELELEREEKEEEMSLYEDMPFNQPTDRQEEQGEEEQEEKEPKGQEE